MRVLRIIFTSLITLFLGGVIGFYAGREIVLYTALNQVRTAVRELRTLQAPAEFMSSCLEYGGGSASESQALTRAQVRFLTSTDFVTEIVCNSTESLRQEFRNQMLPPFAQKSPGQSGIIYGQENAGLTISVLGRVGTVYEEGTFVKTSLQPVEGIVATEGPITSCQGFGYGCCNEAFQEGRGDRSTRATDCPLSCFAQCVDKPVVLVFSSSLQVDRQSRVVKVQSGEPVDFYYTVSDGGDAFAGVQAAADRAALSWPEKIKVLVESVFTDSSHSSETSRTVMRFGDGQTADLSDLQGVVNHAYTCTRALCVYTATIQVITDAGMTSTLGETETIQVQVTP